MIERLLRFLLPHRDITGLDESGIESKYLTRFFIGKRLPIRIFIHKIWRSDGDDALHDHPWDFTTFLIGGGYFEIVQPLEVYRCPLKYWRPRFSILRNRAEHIHRVEVDRPVWTIVLVGRTRRQWGFWPVVRGMLGGWIPWRTFLGTPEAPTEPEDEIQ